MRVDDTGEPGRTVTVDHLLDAAEQAFLTAEFPVVGPLLRRIQGEFGTPSATDDTADAARYAVLRATLAARVGNWAEAVQCCPFTDDLGMAATGVVHALAVAALRRLGDKEGRTDSGTAALAIVLWAYLLDEDDPGGFRALIDGRRDTPVLDDQWENARQQLLGRVGALLHALDVRAGRDVLASWETAWMAECVAPVVVLADAGAEGLIPPRSAALHLVADGRHLDLLDAYAARHPDSGTWTTDSPDQPAYADALGRALAERGRGRAKAQEWSEALADFGTAARLGHPLGSEDRKAVLRAGNSVGRTRNGLGNSTITRIQGLEQAHELLPEDRTLADELTAVLVWQGQQVLDSDPQQSRNRFARALEVSPRDREARSGLDHHLKADLRRALDGAEPQEKLRVGVVESLLRRDPDCAPARRWLEDRQAGRAVAAACGGRTAEARSAVRRMLRYDGGERAHSREYLDDVLVDLLVHAARSQGVESTRSERLARRVDLLSVAADIAGPTYASVGKERDAAVLDLAEHLEGTAPPSDVIALFLRDRTRTGASARFDRIVENAYLRRAKERERSGDLGGARRDRACAERIGAGLPDQGLLFGPAPGHRPDDSGQGALF
ncbi:hypothetical protein [Streptomyces sp. T028]|uniref:hypothetical protein n=1 Tax=Streptomyces sp. T028 TaxID=3394379 RepID=UPI003A88C40B